MIDIMKLAHEYAVRYRVNQAVDEARAALQAAIEALQAEIKELESWKEAARDKLDWQQTDNRLLRVQLETNEAANKTRIAALQAKLDAMGKGEPVAPEQVEGVWQAGWLCRDAEIPVKNPNIGHRG